MKGRESGMPPREMWEGFFNPAETLEKMGLKEANNVAEFGCGYGTFTIPAAKLVKGTVYAIDIEAEMTGVTRQAAEEEGLRNVITVRRDFMREGTGLEAGRVDYVMLFNILHIERPEILLEEAWRILGKAGRAGIIHWNYDAATPRGPSMDIRPRPADCVSWAQSAGFTQPEQYDLKPYHYGIVMRKD